MVFSYMEFKKEFLLFQDEKPYVSNFILCLIILLTHKVNFKNPFKKLLFNNVL